MKATEIVIELKKPPEKLFPQQHPHGNRMRFQIDPEVLIAIEVQARRADTEEFEVEDIELMAMRETAHQVPPYQRLLTAALEGDHNLFASEQTIEEAWRIVDPILDLDTRSDRVRAGQLGTGRGRPAAAQPPLVHAPRRRRGRVPSGRPPEHVHQETQP